MNLNLGHLAFGVASAVFVLTGCAGSDEADVTEAAVSQDELTASAERLVGAFHGAAGSARPPTFESIVFQADGGFVADVDTGIRCITTPCPSHVRLEGSFRATSRFVSLTPAEPAPTDVVASELYGRYQYTLEGGKLSLIRDEWDGWTNDLERSAEELWPSDRQQLVAETSGGGFTPPPPAGSTCAFGAQRYSLDVASRKLAWEVCSFDDWDTPMHLVRGSRTLSPAELRTIDTAMSAVAIATHEICGADKPLLSITVTSASGGAKRYVDSFYSCIGEGTYIDGIDGVFSAFRELI